MKRIVIHECFDKIEFSGDGSRSLTQSQLEELDSYCQLNGFDDKFLEWGKSSLRFFNYVGLIQLSDVSIEILPKIDFTKSNDNDFRHSRRALITMLRRSGYLDVSFSELSLVDYENQSLYEIFASLFASKLEKELVHGTYAEYVQYEDNLNVVKGSIAIPRQICNIALGTPKVHCRFEQHSQDNTVNQLYKQVIQSLQRRVTRLETIKQLNRCLYYFPEVNDCPFTTIEFERVQFNRINKRFEPSFILAKMLLGNQTSLPQRGFSKGFSFVFRMDQLFERYIGSMLCEMMGSRIKLQHNDASLLVNEKTHNNIFRLIPDIVVESGEQAPRLILDTKWKMIRRDQNRHGVGREDLFQMYAYLTRFANVGAALLLYPHHSRLTNIPGTTVESWYLETNQDKRIRIYSSEERTIESLRLILNENSMNMTNAP